MTPTLIDVPGGSVSHLTDGPKDARVHVVLAHGAGADMQHRFMSYFAEGLASRGICVHRFNFLYTESGRKAPDRQPILEETFAAVVMHIRRQFEPKALMLGGKSMGGRIASHVVAAGAEAEGLIFLGYPLHPPGRPERLRAAHLSDIAIPMLFVEGTRDPFCPLETLEKVRADLSAPTTVAVIDDGDHSFKVRKSSGRSTDEAWDEAVAAASTWMTEVTTA